jgi:integrase
MLLTNQSVSRLAIEPGKSERIDFDDKLSGWGVRLRAGGKRTWIIQYRIGRQQRRLTLGSVDKVPADKARSDAKIKLGLVEQGTDPAIQRADRTKAAGITFKRQFAAFTEYTAERVRPRTLDEITRHLNEHWAPLHTFPLDSIHRADVAAQLIEIKKQRGPIAANRARATLSSFFGWAMREGLTERNPVVGTNLPAEETPRERVLSDLELVAIWKAAGDADDYGRIIRLLILTGQRRSEIGGMMRAELDRTKRMLSLPPERTKNGRPHDVPLSDEAMAILAAIDDDEDRGFLFGRRDTGFSGWGKAKSNLDERLGKAAAPWTLHDLRRTCRTGLSALGIVPHVAEAVINHVSSLESGKRGVSGVYDRYAYVAEKRQALDMWGAHVAALVAGKAAGKIVSLRQA